MTTYKQRYIQLCRIKAHHDTTKSKHYGGGTHVRARWNCSNWVATIASSCAVTSVGICRKRCTTQGRGVCCLHEWMWHLPGTSDSSGYCSHLWHHMTYGPVEAVFNTIYSVQYDFTAYTQDTEWYKIGESILLYILSKRYYY